MHLSAHKCGTVETIFVISPQFQNDLSLSLSLHLYNAVMVRQATDAPVLRATGIFRAKCQGRVGTILSTWQTSKDVELGVVRHHTVPKPGFPIQMPLFAPALLLAAPAPVTPFVTAASPVCHWTFRESVRESVAV